MVREDLIFTSLFEVEAKLILVLIGHNSQFLL